MFETALGPLAWSILWPQRHPPPAPPNEEEKAEVVEHEKVKVAEQEVCVDFMVDNRMQCFVWRLFLPSLLLL